ncbi:hypothetical protein [Vibrio mexicanus]|uniref:hypothetical protein n=1 Tax=Vibrio mexicanus TaxID=1004326 RepID=UPI00063C4248|nr:hypothetical protein [Vibrio mexicanus]
MNKSTLNELLLCSAIGTGAMLGYGAVWNWVSVDSLIMAIVSAIIMALVLKSSVAFEKWAADKCLSQKALPKIKRFFSSWMILIGSKVIAMGAIVMLFGEQVQFSGPAGGVISFYITIISIVIIESLVLKSFNKTKLAAS